MYSIGHAAEQVGISAATLRAWERRYAVVRPTRTDGDYRIYSADDIRVLRSMKELIEAGWSSRFAAQEALRRQATEALPPPQTAAAVTDTSEQFVAAAASLDSRKLDQVLDQMFSLGSFETVVGQYLFPALRALGEAWESGHVTVAGEHLASHAVARRLAAAYDAAGTSGGVDRVLIGLPPGCHHELGVFAFAVAARRQGLAVDFLGADVPVGDWVAAAAGSTPASAVVLAISCDRDVTAARDVVSALHSHNPRLPVAAGGAAADQAPSNVVRLGDDLPEAVQTLALTIAGA